jgi:hypothetical protein
VILIGRPNLEYAASVWSPHQGIHSARVEQIQYTVFLGLRYVVIGPTLIGSCHLPMPGVFWWVLNHLLTEGR